jgi:hypothetical protein
MIDNAADGGATWATVTDGGVYSGATTTTLAVTGVTGVLNGAQFRAWPPNSVGATTSGAADPDGHDMRVTPSPLRGKCVANTC